MSPRVDLSVPANVHLTLTSHLVWSYDTATQAFALVHQGGSPSLHVAAHVTLAASGDAAIGIMGVTVQNTSTFSLDVAMSRWSTTRTTTGTWRSPTRAGRRRAAAAGAAAGLFHPTLDTPGRRRLRPRSTSSSKALTGFPAALASARRSTV